MPKNNFQKGSAKISTFAGIAIIAAIVVIASTIAIIKYRERHQAIVPVAMITPKLSPNVTPTPTSIIDPETADWKTYKSEKNGFEVLYPKNYSISIPETDESEESVRLDSDITFKNAKIEYLYEIDFADLQKTYNQDSQIEITVYNNGNDYTLEKWLEKYSETLPTNASLGVDEEITIDNIKGLKGGFGCCMTAQHTAFLKKDDKIYQISSGFQNFKTGIYSNEKMFEQILSTFKFTK